MSSATKGSSSSSSSPSVSQSDGSSPFGKSLKPAGGGGGGRGSLSGSSSSSSSSSSSPSSVPSSSLLSKFDFQDLVMSTFLSKYSSSSLLNFRRLIKLFQTTPSTAAPQPNVWRKLITLNIELFTTGKITSLSSASSASSGSSDNFLKSLKTIQSDDTLSVLFDGIFDIFRYSLRVKLKDSQLQSDLSSFSLPAPFVSDLVSSYSVRFGAMEKFTVERSLGTKAFSMIPNFRKLQWRVDVIISTTSLMRVFKPLVFLQMTTSDGKITQMEMSMEMFQQFRYFVAKMLKSVQEINSHPMIARDFD